MMRAIQWFVWGQLCVFVLGVPAAPVFGDEASGATKGATLPKSYQECVDSGGRIEETVPARCALESGVVFVEPPQGRGSACKDLCGDGECQEIVCMAVGCPCSESPTTCPKDCAP